MDEATKVISYYDKSNKVLGCPHYQLKAKILAPCCKRWVCCRFCHDSDYSCASRMDRFAVSQMKCMLCLTEQHISQTCKHCKVQMGRYYCHICRLIDDGPNKKIFHCHKCGLCLSGCQNDYFHCRTCNACVAISARNKHGCRERVLDSDCPICADRLLGSTSSSIVQPPCQHLMHTDCLNEHIKHSYKCPVCLASLCDTQSLFESIDCYMKISVMPVEYQDKRSLIFCNDCQQRSETRFHFVYHKCQNCCSYNTTLLEAIAQRSENLL